jgi:hypothetical protein
LHDVEQVLVTAAVREDVPSSMAAQLITISAGTVMAPGDGSDI